MRKHSKKIAYIAISQYESVYEHKMQSIEFDTIFVEKVSVKDSRRPELERMINGCAVKGDQIFVYDLSCLGRSVSDLWKIIGRILELNVEITFVKEKLTFRKDFKDSSDFKNVYEILTLLAAFEASLIKKRQREGIDAAKAAGKHLGRPKKIRQEQRTEIIEKYKQGKTPTEIAKSYNISRGSVYNIIAELSKKIKTNESEQTIEISSAGEKPVGNNVPNESVQNINKAIARRLAKEMAEKYEKKYSPVFEDLFAAIIGIRCESYSLIKDQVKQYTGYSKYKSGYLMSKIIPKLQSAGLIYWPGEKSDTIVWRK